MTKTDELLVILKKVVENTDAGEQRCLAEGNKEWATRANGRASAFREVVYWLESGKLPTLKELSPEVSDAE